MGGMLRPVMKAVRHTHGAGAVCRWGLWHGISSHTIHWGEEQLWRCWRFFFCLWVEYRYIDPCGWGFFFFCFFRFCWRRPLSLSLERGPSPDLPARAHGFAEGQLARWLCSVFPRLATCLAFLACHVVGWVGGLERGEGEGGGRGACWGFGCTLYSGLVAT